MLKFVLIPWLFSINLMICYFQLVVFCNIHQRGDTGVYLRNSKYGDMLHLPFLQLMCHRAVLGCAITRHDLSLNAGASFVNRLVKQLRFNIWTNDYIRIKLWMWLFIHVLTYNSSAFMAWMGNYISLTNIAVIHFTCIMHSRVCIPCTTWTTLEKKTAEAHFIDVD